MQNNGNISPHKNKMDTPRRLPMHTIDSPKLPLLSTKISPQILVARFIHERA
jgi:hypothetical protein